MAGGAPGAGLVVETERLVVRAWRPEDAEAAFAVYGDPEVARYLGSTGRPVPDLEAQRAWLGRVIAGYAERPGLGLWAVVERATGEVVGGAELVPLEGGPEVEVGYHLARRAWGRGYATEVARALLRHGFQTLGLPRVVAVAYPANPASHRVLRKAGLRHAGRRLAFGHDLEYFVLDRPDWAATEDATRAPAS